MRQIINSYGKGSIDWACLSTDEQLVIENMILIVGVLYNMCKVKLVNKQTSEALINNINKVEIEKAENEAYEILNTINAA